MAIRKRLKHFYEFGRFRLDVAERNLTYDGIPISLPPKVYETLVVLVRNRDHTLDKQELMSEVWPDTFVEEGNLAQNISLLRKALSEHDDAVFIQTVAKRGYRFVALVNETVSAEQPEITEPVSAQCAHLAEPGVRPRPVIEVAVMLLLASALVIGCYSVFRKGTNAPRSIAILPFRNEAGAAAADFLTDGIPEALITRLARLRNLNVLSFSRVRRYTMSNDDLGQIGRQLGVDAILQGTLRRSGKDLRIHLHLVQATTGFELWGHVVTLPSSSNLLQNEEALVEQIASRLRQQLTPTETLAVRRAGTNDATAYELLLRAKQLLTRSTFRSDNVNVWEVACEMLQQAVQRDPNFADAHAWLAYGLHRRYTSGAAAGDRATLDAAVASAKRALSLDQESPVGLMALTFLDQATGREKEALDIGTRLLRTHPNDLDALAAGAEVYFRTGMLDRAVPLFEKILDADPSNLLARTQLARSYLYLGQYEKGLNLLPPDPGQSELGLWAMLILKEVGQYSKAAATAQRYTYLNPNDAVGWYFAGCVLTAAGQAEEAAAIWTEGARRIESTLGRAENPYTRMFLALIYARLNLREPAERHAQRVLVEHPNRHWALFFNAKMKAIVGDRGAAILFFRQSLDNGFLTLQYVDYHRRPAMGLHNLDRDPEFQTIRDQLARNVAELQRSSMIISDGSTFRLPGAILPRPSVYPRTWR